MNECDGDAAARVAEQHPLLRGGSDPSRIAPFVGFTGVHDTAITFPTAYDAIARDWHTGTIAASVSVARTLMKRTFSTVASGGAGRLDPFISGMHVIAIFATYAAVLLSLQMWIINDA